MSTPHPVVYLLHGDDDLAIQEFLQKILAAAGDPGMVEVNTTRMDGRALSFDELTRATSAMPFLLPRRLVILSHPLARLKSPADRKKLLDLLNKVPPTTALILLEYERLTDEKDLQKGKLHWLEAWAQQAGERVLMRVFALPHGAAMARWIVARAKTLGGQFSEAAASRLAELTGDEPRVVDQEIQKILMYVNFSRPVDVEDVDHLTPDSRQGDVFAMVDAMGQRDGRRAQAMLHRLLAEQDFFSLFGMVTRQFRLLIQARDVLDNGGQAEDLARLAKLNSFVAKKLFGQVRLFSMGALDTIYRRLLAIDEEVKTSQIEGDVALDALIASLTG